MSMRQPLVNQPEGNPMVWLMLRNQLKKGKNLVRCHRLRPVIQCQVRKRLQVWTLMMQQAAQT